MQKSEIKQKAGDLVREMVREKEIANTSGVLSYIPDILDCVSIDTGSILHCVDKELNRKTANPLNALLSLFGLRIVHTKNAISDLNAELNGNALDMVTLEVADSSRLASFLRFDDRLLRAAVDKMANELRQVEDEQKSVQISLREQIETLHKEVDKYCRLFSTEKTELDYQLNTVAERAQYILSLAGENPENPLMRDQTLELLADLEMSAYWSAEGTEMKDSYMFSVLKCEEPAKRKNKPCIVKSGSPKEDLVVLCKGVRFVADQDPEHEDPQPTEETDGGE